MTDWQPIETAPKGPDIILGWGKEGGGYVRAGHWHGVFGWVILQVAQSHYIENQISDETYEHLFGTEENPPTDWMPLPEPPA